ncbi:MAG: 6-phosphofructokinase, partial [Fibrobacterota bacterium]
MAKKTAKRLGILTGGGDTCALNGSIETIKNMAHVLGYEVYGIRFGWKGLLGKGDMINLSKLPIDGWRGGSILYSSRTNPFKVKTTKGVADKSKEVMQNIKRYGLDLIISIGGDDTNGAAKALFEKYGIPVIGFPKTIDNDLRTRTTHKYRGKKIEAGLCPGFPTAAKVVRDVAKQLRTTADTHKRAFVVEIMGRDAGWLVGSAAHGGAEVVLVPEIVI